MKKIIAVVTSGLMLVTFAIIGTGALALSQYSPVIGSATMGQGYVYQQAYPTFNDFDFYVLSENTPVFNTDEDEIRITNNYMRLEVPRIVNHGLQTTAQWDSSAIAVSMQNITANYMYQTQVYNEYSVGTLVTSVNAGDPNGEENLRSCSVAVLSPTPSIPSALYAVGNCYGRVINGIPYSVGFVLPEACTVSVQGQFYLTRKATGAVESWGINKTSTQTGVFNITPMILGDGYEELFSFDEFVFSGQIYVQSQISSSIAMPSIRMWYDITDTYYAEVNNSVLGTANHDGYAGNPIIDYLYGSATGERPSEVLNVTENGHYVLDGYGYANVNVPQTLEWGSMFDWIFDSIGAFMAFEIAPGWNIGVIMSIVVSLAVGIWLMRLFMGG